jgi:transposase-like protein
MASVTVTCRYCNSDLVYKHGHAQSGEPRYRCRCCQRSFQISYRYEAHKQGTPAKIINMAMNGSGVRDTSRVLGVSVTTVIAHLKKIKARQSQSSAPSSGDGAV